jgi:hypothetical protein
MSDISPSNDSSAKPISQIRARARSREAVWPFPLFVT